MAKNSFTFVLLSLMCIQLAFAAETYKLVESENESCLRPCFKIMNPVCGSDGKIVKLFNNSCLMQQYSCQTKLAWTKVPLEKCLNKETLRGRSLCERPCHMIFLPVCATNGSEFKVFANECVMEVFNCDLKKKFTKANYTDCKNDD